MRHKSGRIEQNNHQTDSNFSNSEATFSSSVPPLTDANYEFLFNQLLEGVAHGWHSKRIVKFFHQLGERGKQANWVSWLERFQSKISGTSSVSIQQMATLMMRLGELTKSTPEVQQLGAVSYQIGQQILFSSTKNVIWEYDGADFQPDSPSVTPSTKAETQEENISEIAPNLTGKVVSHSSSEIELNASQVPEVELAPEKSPSTTKETIPELDLEGNSSNIPSLPETNLEEPALVKEAISSELDLDHTSNNISSSSETNLEEPALAREAIPPELNSNHHSSEFHQTSSEVSNSKTSEPVDEQSNQPDLQELMKMIQENEKLVQQISKKLNISSPDVSPSTNSQPVEAVDEPHFARTQQQASDQLQSNNLNGKSPENSVMELVETWFNLGLKQVSIGDFNGAIDSWEKALNLNPNLSEAWHNRGSALGRLSRYEEAIESFGRSLIVAPNNYQAWNDRAHALYQLEKWQEASESWAKAIEIMPGNHLFWYNRGCALEQLNNIAESIASYEKALEIKPDFQPARSRYINLIADNSAPN